MIKATQHILVACCVISLMISCTSGYDYWQLSEFNMDPTALQDEDPITILYFSNGPAQKDNDGVFLHVIAVKQHTTDTINILTPSNPGISPEDGGKVYNFLAIDSDIGKISVAQLTHALDQYTKVIRDPEFDAIAHNQYPTVIGFIGFVSQDKNFDPTQLTP